MEDQIKQMKICLDDFHQQPGNIGDELDENPGVSPCDVWKKQVVEKPCDNQAGDSPQTKQQPGKIPREYQPCYEHKDKSNQK